MSISFIAERDAAVCAAKQAGVLIKEAFHSLQASHKDTIGADLVTKTDIASQELIESLLSEKFPFYSFIGEETKNNFATFHNSTCWVVDPIDGTTNFVHGIPFVCVSIGLCVNGEPIVGVVFNPITEELFTAIKNCGAFYNEKPLVPTPTPFLTMQQKLIGTEYGVERSGEALDSKLDSVDRVLRDGNVRGVRAFGSSALACCYVAKHSLDAFWEAGIHVWDICAGSVIVREAGGCMVNWDNGKSDCSMDLDLFCRKFLVVRSVEGAIEETVRLIRKYLNPIRVDRDE